MWEVRTGHNDRIQRLLSILETLDITTVVTDQLPCGKGPFTDTVALVLDVIKEINSDSTLFICVTAEKFTYRWDGLLSFNKRLVGDVAKTLESHATPIVIDGFPDGDHFPPFLSAADSTTCQLERTILKAQPTLLQNAVLLAPHLDTPGLRYLWYDDTSIRALSAPKNWRTHGMLAVTLFARLLSLLDDTVCRVYSPSRFPEWRKTIKSRVNTHAVPLDASTFTITRRYLSRFSENTLTALILDRDHLRVRRLSTDTLQSIIVKSLTQRGVLCVRRPTENDKLESSLRAKDIAFPGTAAFETQMDNLAARSEDLIMSLFSAADVCIRYATLDSLYEPVIMECLCHPSGSAPTPLESAEDADLVSRLAALEIEAIIVPETTFDNWTFRTNLTNLWGVVCGISRRIGACPEHPIFLSRSLTGDTISVQVDGITEWNKAHFDDLLVTSVPPGTKRAWTHRIPASQFFSTQSEVAKQIKSRDPSVLLIGYQHTDICFDIFVLRDLA